MGIRQRVVQQTITEYVCDLCKKDVAESDAQVGSLTVKAAGARGRPRVLEVAFHATCLRSITGAKPTGQKAAKRSSAPKAKKRSPRKGSSSKSRSKRK